MFGRKKTTEVAASDVPATEAAEAKPAKTKKVRVAKPRMPWKFEWDTKAYLPGFCGLVIASGFWVYLLTRH